MKVRDLINLPGDEHPDSEVRIVASKRQEDWHNFTYNSRVAGVSELPVKIVVLMATFEQPKGATKS
jgi:hypothetical protein